MEHFYGVVVVAFNTTRARARATTGPPSTGAAIAWAAQPARLRPVTGKKVGGRRLFAH